VSQVRGRSPLVASEAKLLLEELTLCWPLPVPARADGYRPRDLGTLTPVATLPLDGQQALVVISGDGSMPLALPCHRAGSGWRMAQAGDGTAAALLRRLGDGGSRKVRTADFRLAPLARPWGGGGQERELGTDQSNLSVIVDDRVIVKWHVAADSDGRRALLIRQHLRVNGFLDTPPLLAYVTWTDPTGTEWPLVEVDGYLPMAQDGWDHTIAALLSEVGEGPPVATAATDLGRVLGELSARLHGALARPSDVVTEPVRVASPGEMETVREAGFELLDRALAIDAPAQHVVVDREARLRRTLASMPIGPHRLQLVHGDLHLGQVVAWRDGLALIDFDGAPSPTEPAGAHGSRGRDLAQLACSLWNLAAVVDARTDAAHHERLRAWAARAERDLLATYRATCDSLGLTPFDGRLLEAFFAEQVCRELLYAQEKLPRWRYAPLQVLRWRYPLEDELEH
jgi:maltokinase